jgi:beta-lactamase regulating signal transducer with metallopeptidase domain
VTQSNAPGRISILPELLVITLLAVGSLTPLVLSSGVEALDWIFDHAPDSSLPLLHSLVGLDAWLHGLARILIGTGIASVVFRRVGPFLSFRRRMAQGPILAPRPGTALCRLAEQHGRSSSVWILPASHGPVAFTAGILNPQVYLSEVILDALDERELELLILHEFEHCRSMDPARSLFTTILADLFFWLPAVRAVEARVMAKIEFAADEAAARLDRARLALTILKVVRLGSTPELASGVVSFSRRSGVASRVQRLMRRDDETQAGAKSATRSAVHSTIAILVALWMLGFTAFGTHHAHQDQGPDGHSSIVHTVDMDSA